MDKEQALIKISSFIISTASKHLLRKAVFSKPCDKTLLKAVISERIISGKPSLQAEFFHKDNKVTHKNFTISELDEESLAVFCSEYMQINLLCHGAECEYRVSTSGNSTIIGAGKIEKLIVTSNQSPSPILIQGNNRQKERILTGNEPFLRLLGVSDENGRVYDKKQSKFKQINRFLEIIRDTEDKLPSDSVRICDLCCGKSYLSFAVYHYFSAVRHMKVTMTGVDLKPDVIKHCSEIAQALNFDELDFICGDVRDYTPESLPSLVISLHACDFATDIVLQKAAEWRADVILSTPCCHHELNHNIDCKELSFITEHSMLRQKLCDAATDALRLCRLEAQGYSTSAVELIDPNETPKNIMLRAIRKKSFSLGSNEAADALERYLTAKKFLCGNNDVSSLHF